ncbi:hypothetical protein EIP91_002673 [Steccherinum ochraceum]|uniref:AB hydrolase-1 domain-containing protein n=1 Tax=Steccherinum ochraceum TaxID=92696 RepID=A0A4R0RKA3_9APHY|nr:hypothetical protein EIP91_002673 [Steccherinum ochraceum]
MQSESYVFDPRPDYPLVTTAKRYWHPKFYSEDSDALTLIFTHGTGFHKEHWEPTIEDLYAALEKSSKPPKICDIWSLDCANHGDAAVINEQELQWGYSHVFAWEEYGRSIHAFLTGQGVGVPVDFSKRRLVAIGHSMGAISHMLLTTLPVPVTYSAMILVEPMLLPPPTMIPDSDALISGAQRRRDIWPSRNAAYEILQSRPSWKIWDPRVLKLFVEHGLRDLPTATYPDKQEGVTLICPRDQEVACYSDKLGRSRAYKFLPTLCSRLPVHFIWGSISEPYLTTETKDYVSHTVAQGKAASVAKVPNAGHLVVQINPTGLAKAIYDVLRQEMARGQPSEPTVVSRL